jgi:hypothetical protein
MRSPQRFNRPRQRVAKTLALPAPTGGWDAISALADMPADRAIVLDNWFPSTSDVRVRNGHTLHASGVGGDTDDVETLMYHHNIIDASSKMFAVAGGDVYDVTSSGEATITSVVDLNNSRLQWVNFTTSGGHYLYWVNGADAPQHFDGTSWTTPAITGITESEAVHINVHKNRIWFVMVNSTKAAYLATGAVAGAATEFELGGLFTKGGYLNAMATWTLDGGSGTDDLAVFISSQGQCAVYQGTDPASADTWALIGVFDLAPPIGRRCFTKVAGDIALINMDGVLPLSRALQQDRASTQAIAITRNIQNAMAEAAELYGENFGWELTAYPKGTMAILNVPLTATEKHQYVMNTLTGAWCRFKGQNAASWIVFRNNLYFGSINGKVMQADDETSNDYTDIIDAVGQTSYNYFKPREGLKQFTMMQTLLVSAAEVSASVGISTDFKDNVELSTPSTGSAQGAVFDSAVWDTSTFGSGSAPVSDWTTVAGIGTNASIHFRARTGADINNSLWGEGLWGSAEWAEELSDAVDLRLFGFNILYQPGAVL